jgi:hypothetical protein
MPTQTVATRNPADALTLQLLEWIAAQPRSYAEVLEVWKTSCPKLTIWEDACIAGLVDCNAGDGRMVRVSARGRELLSAERG